MDTRASVWPATKPATPQLIYGVATTAKPGRRMAPPAKEEFAITVAHAALAIALDVALETNNRDR